MQHDQKSTPFLQAFVRPLCYSTNQDTIAIGQDTNHILLLNKNDLNRQTYVQTAHTDRVASIKLTDKLLARGGTEGTLSLWDNRQLANSAPIHTFNRPGCKFNTIDISEHILAAGTSKRVIFWDLRKMKQRCEFNESFNEDITALQFSKDIPTVLYATSYDGLISKFDLSEKSEEDAFLWGHKIIESPCHLQVVGNIALIQTQNQILLTLEEQSLKDRYEINSIEKPTHILSSFLGPERQIHYYTRNMRNNALDYWVGKHHLGFIPTSIATEMLIPVHNEKVIFSDDQGNWYYDQVHKGKNYSKETSVNKDFMTVEEWEQTSGKKIQDKLCNKNGFIISKPSTLKSNSKKFKPY